MSLTPNSFEHDRLRDAGVAMPVPSLREALRHLTPTIATVFAAFAAAGLALPVMPLHVHDDLGMSTFIVGIVAGTEFVATMMMPATAGSLADTRGPRQATMLGIVLTALAGAIYLFSLTLHSWPAASVAVLIGGRFVLGAGESLIVTSGLSWSLATAGVLHTSRTIAWLGIAMYTGVACAAPLGILLYEHFGFGGVAVATMLLPWPLLLVVRGRATVTPVANTRLPFRVIIHAVWLPGLGLAACSVGLGVTTAFDALLFTQRGWGTASIGFGVFGVAYVLSRLLLGHLPDRHGGGRLALIFVSIEAIGLLLTGWAPDRDVVLIGVAMTGAGYSMALPSFGVEATRRAPALARGATMGSFLAFLNISLAATGPIAGLIAHRFGVAAIYPVAALAVACGLFAARALARQPPLPLQ